MAGNLNTLARRFDKLAKELPDRVNERTVEMAVKIVDNLAHVTPVDTSQALSNWQVGIGKPIPGFPGGAIEPHVRGEKGSTQAASASAAVASAKAVLAARKQGQVIYISNVLRYIRKLNDGSSKQEPAGFVARAVLVGRKFLQSSRKRLLRR